MTNCLTAASSLVIRRRRPFSLIATRSLKAAATIVLRLRAPFGRPRGLPDCRGESGSSSVGGHNRPVRSLRWAQDPARSSIPPLTARPRRSPRLRLRAAVTASKASPVVASRRRASGVRLPATNDHVAIERVELEPVASPPGPLAGHQGRAAAEKRIEDDVAATRHVENRVSDHRRRLDRRMQGGEMSLFARPAKARAYGIGPDVAAVPAIGAQLDVVAMAAGSKL